MKSRTQLWILFAGPVVTLAVGLGWTFDNVNTVKLFALGFVAGFAAANIFLAARKSRKMLFSPIFILAWFFLLGLLIPVFFSNSPIAQQLYGDLGRNLGFLHYFFLVLILLAFSNLEAKSIWPRILRSIAIVGFLESLYGFLQYFGYDPIPWENSQKWIVGTFGNPNYLSSFLALSVIATVYLAIKEKSFAAKFLALASALFQSSVIILSGSSQGFILVVFGLFATLTILIFQRSKTLGWIVFSLGSLAALTATFGVFQSGPLARYVYQDSISFRGDYWRAGIKMFSENWVHGVGLDSYGDYYRMYRDSTAANRRGLEIFSSSAHNLFIDLAATGGIILLMGYLAILGLVSLSIFSAFMSGSKITLEYKVLITLWLAFNLQTLISINVPAIAVWGWIFSGLILAYGNEGKYSNTLRIRDKKKKRNYIIASSIGCAACMVLVLPLISRDFKFKNALLKNDIQGITQAVLAFPRDADHIAQMAILFGKANLDKESLELAKEAILENPNSSPAWQVVIKSSLANQAEKDQAVEALTNLDPFFAATLK